MNLELIRIFNKCKYIHLLRKNKRVLFFYIDICKIFIPAQVEDLDHGQGIKAKDVYVSIKGRQNERASPREAIVPRGMSSQDQFI
jgi:hypothetical protein